MFALCFPLQRRHKLLVKNRNPHLRPRRTPQDLFRGEVPGVRSALIVGRLEPDIRQMPQGDAL